MPVVIRTRIDYVAPAGITARRLPRHVKQSLQAAGILWHDKMLPRHFQSYASAKYGYKHRAAWYREQKQAGMGPAATDRPLVWSGDTERQATSSARIGGTSKRLRVTMDVPFYFGIQSASRPDLVAELIAWTAAEGLHLARFVSADLAARLAAESTRTSVTV